jgi:hypothetical protein
MAKKAVGQSEAPGTENCLAALPDLDQSSGDRVQLADHPDTMWYSRLQVSGFLKPE